MEGPKEIAIVDASVVVKWFVEEQYTENALKMAEDYRALKIDLRSAQLMPFEVLNALRFNPEMGRSELEKVGDALKRFRIALYPMLGELQTLCLKIAFDHGLTIYDASYVSLGQLLNCNVYTADSKVINKMKGNILVKPLSNYGKEP